MSDLERARKLAELFVQQKARVKELEEATKKAKADFRRTSEEDLPQLLQEVGLQEFTLEDGTKIKTKPDCTVSIPAERRDEAMRWLVDNDNGGLIKTVVACGFGRGEREQAEEFAATLAGQHDDVTVKEDVHHSTLKSFVLEQIASGEPFPLDLFGVRPFDKAVVG